MQKHTNKVARRNPNFVKPSNRNQSLDDVLAAVPGGYYVVIGIWPLISMRTFERVTGPKLDKWLVKTVGILVTVAGTTLLVGMARRNVTPD
jgi:hypothetical protein